MQTYLSEHAFERLADQELQALIEALYALGDAVDPDLAGGVLTIEFEDESKYVINSHRAAKQIWMAAEHTAWHFDYDPGAGRWRAAASGEELWSALEATLSHKLREPIQLQRGSRD